MHQTSPYKHSLILRNLGHCDRCMKKALISSICAWGVFALVSSIGGYPTPAMAVAVIAFVLSLLWLAHLTGYALRATRSIKMAPVDPSGRRRTLGLMVRAAGIGMLASVPVTLLPTAAAAFCGQCTKNADCGYGFSCKNTAPVNSGKVCNECVED
ncbi:DUF3624 family protein [uncultured Roseibium sp.]|uniref:DUF3624 family protein n=1 Tax=uncultured Roseibium sp. TaxID=1936171 RepID=UPI0032175731